MKTLNLHVDYIKFKPLKKALKSIGELSEKDKKEKEVKEALVVLTAIEKCDNNVSEVVKQLVENVKDIASQVKTKNIVLYPYAHLSKDLGSPDIAQEILEKAEKVLIKEKFSVTRAPFGYYKEFELKVKGHPLSELSREIRMDEVKGKVIAEKYDEKQLLREI
jgi:threonyl-tRNA synthetase